MVKDIVTRENTTEKQRNRLLVRAGKVLLLLALCYGGYLWHLSYTGYCFKERRYLTDEELIQAAIRHNLDLINIDGSDEAIKTFHAKNPGCCRVNRLSQMASATWFEKLLGFYYVEVELNFEARPQRSQINRSTSKPLNFYTQYVEITACGKRGEMYGEHTEKLKEVPQF